MKQADLSPGVRWSRQIDRKQVRSLLPEESGEFHPQTSVYSGDQYKVKAPGEQEILWEASQDAPSADKEL